MSTMLHQRAVAATPEPPSDLIPIPEAAATYPLTAPTFRNYIKSGRLTGYRLGARKLFVSRAEVAGLFSVVETGLARGEQ